MASKVGKHSKKQSKKRVPKPRAMQDVDKSNKREIDISQRNVQNNRRSTENSSAQPVSKYVKLQMCRQVFYHSMNTIN